MKYRKKPVEVEALLFDGTEDNVTVIMKWSSWKARRVPNYSWNAKPDAICMYIETLEGTMIADPGDYIIKGSQGEFYPCKPDIFKATYDAIVEAER